MSKLISKPASRSTLLASAAIFLTASIAHAAPFNAGDLVVSYSVYQGNASTVTVGQALPNTNGAVAIANGTYPGVFANDTPDGNFGVTSPIFVQDVTTPNQITATSTPTVNVTALTGVVTSFSSKSELAINLSTNGTSLTLGDYVAPLNALDVSNANTPGVQDPTNSDTAAPAARAVVQINANGTATATGTNNYAGNNIRAAILNNATNTYITTGNSGNGAKATDSVTTPGTIGASLLATTGVQVVTPGTGTSGQAGRFTTNATVSPGVDNYPLKDNNFRGETISNNTLFVTKGSGSNGVDTVYQVGTAGSLPTGNGSSTLTILPGFPTQYASNQTCTLGACSNYYLPFGIFFANSTTLYVADEGLQSTAGVSDANAGLEKWSLVNGVWVEDYVLQTGLNLDTQYSVPTDANGDIYPTALDPFNTGLRNLTGSVNANGTVTLYAATATYSASGDPGADPNSIVSITDTLADFTSAQAASEAFSTVEGPQYGVVYRGVALAPVPEPASAALFGLAVAALAFCAAAAGSSRAAERSGAGAAAPAPGGLAAIGQPQSPRC